MNTKIVYVLVFDDKNIYYEQALASVWSLKHYNDCRVTVVTDEESRQLMTSGWRAQYASLFDEITAFHFEPEVSKMERSRQLKTTLRSRVFGDFLFIDTDTIITGDLSEIDTLTCDIAMVEDMNCAFDKNPHYADILRRNEQVFGQGERKSIQYFNSGVIYAKDNQQVNEFYRKWHDNWTLSKTKGVMLDQPALYETCLEFQDFVSVLSGNYNCQAVINVSHLSTAKVMHFFNTKDKKNAVSPFIDGSIYRQIKENKGLSEQMLHDILHCKECFVSPIMLASDEDILAWHSKTFDFIKYLQQRHHRIFVLTDILSNKLLNIICKQK